MLNKLLGRKDRPVRDTRELKVVTTRLDRAEKRLTLIETELKVLRGEVS